MEPMQGQWKAAVLGLYTPMLVVIVTTTTPMCTQAWMTRVMDWTTIAIRGSTKMESHFRFTSMSMEMDWLEPRYMLLAHCHSMGI